MLYARAIPLYRGLLEAGDHPRFAFFPQNSGVSALETAPPVTYITRLLENAAQPSYGIVDLFLLGAVRKYSAAVSSTSEFTQQYLLSIIFTHLREKKSPRCRALPYDWSGTHDISRRYPGARAEGYPSMQCTPRPVHGNGVCHSEARVNFVRARSVTGLFLKSITCSTGRTRNKPNRGKSCCLSFGCRAPERDVGEAAKCGASWGKG